MVERLVFGQSGRETLDLERLQSSLAPTLNNAALCGKFVRQQHFVSCQSRVLLVHMYRRAFLLYR